MALTFILSDESINSYGTRILTDGIVLTLFIKNPIMLWMHNRAWRGSKDEVLPIGHWENIRKENGKLLADAVFDEHDEFAQSIKSKVEQNILRMASVGVNVIATSEDKAVVVQGQTRPTIVKSLLTEASICDIGSNRNALRMYDEFGTELNLSDGNADNHLLPLLPLLDQTNQTDHDMNLQEKIIGALKMQDTPTEEQLLARLTQMQTDVAEVPGLRTRITAYEKAEIERTEATVAALVDTAISERRITADDREKYLGFARMNFEDTRAILEKMPAAVDLSARQDQARKPDPWEARFAEINKNK